MWCVRLGTTHIVSVALSRLSFAFTLSRLTTRSLPASLLLVVVLISYKCAGFDIPHEGGGKSLMKGKGTRGWLPSDPG